MAEQADRNRKSIKLQAFINEIKDTDTLKYTSIQDTRLRVANIKKCLPIKERRVSN